MYRPQQPGNRRLINQYDALFSAQARIANSVAHTETLIAAATAAIDRTRSALAASPQTTGTPAARDEA